MNNEEKASQIWQEYLNGVKFQQSMGFTTDFPKFINFKEGNQWAQVTENTRNLPRPIFNITEMFIRNKRGAITNQTLEIDYIPLEIFNEQNMQELAEQGAKDFSDYSKIIWENLDQDELNNELVDDALTLGTGILHYYWDDTKTGGNQLRWQGEIAGEVLDPLNVFFSNPQETKVQQQEWIIIQNRMTIKQIKKLAIAEGINKEQIMLIGADNNESGEYDSEQKEVKENDKVTILIKYYKKNDEVYYSKSISNMVIVDDRPLTPDTATTKIKLYPLTVMNAIRRKKSIYGIGIAQDIISVNKAINQLKAMQLLNAIQCGNPVILAKKNALRQKITNQGGQIITDYEQNGDGIKYLQPPNFTSEFSRLGNEIFELARTTTGVTDVSTGETIGPNMAASAIIALQNQAKTPIQELQNRYYSTNKEVGDIWLQFFKTYYSTDRNITVENENGEIENRIFNGSKFADIDYKLKVKVAVATEKETLTVSILDNMRNKNDINKEQYVELMPDTAMPFKEKIKDIWKDEKKDLLVEALEQIKQYQLILQENGIQTNQQMPNLEGGNANEMQ